MADKAVCLKCEKAVNVDGAVLLDLQLRPFARFRLARVREHDSGGRFAFHAKCAEIVIQNLGCLKPGVPLKIFLNRPIRTVK